MEPLLLKKTFDCWKEGVLDKLLFYTGPCTSCGIRKQCGGQADCLIPGSYVTVLKPAGQSALLGCTYVTGWLGSGGTTPLATSSGASAAANPAV